MEGKRQLSDGRLYFRHNVGAVYKFAAGFAYKVVAADLAGGEEYYQIESDGKLLPAKFSLRQLDMTLAQLRYEVQEEGTPEELPLLDEEIIAYFDARKKFRNKQNAQTNKALKEAGYFKILSAVQTLGNDIILAVITGDERLPELQKQQAEQQAKIAAILKEHNVDEKILHKTADCGLCGDTGFIAGARCECTRGLSEKIKAYNAERRKRG